MSKKIKISLIICPIFIFMVVSGLIWKKVNNFSELKLGFITDWEYATQKDIGDKMANQAPAEMEKAVNYLNDVFKPEMVVAGGDMVESSINKPEKVKILLKEINDIFSKLTAQRGYVMGNHDLRKLNKAEVREILGMEANHSYIDLGDWRLVLGDTNFKIEDGADLGPNYYVTGNISESEMAWLAEVLATDRPTILFIHHSPIPNIDNKNIANRDEIRAFLEKFPNLAMVVSGHDPSVKLEESNGIYYFIANNLVDRKAMGSFATITAKYNKFSKKVIIDIEHHGTVQKKFQIEKKWEHKNNWKNLLSIFKN